MLRRLLQAGAARGWVQQQTSASVRVWARGGGQPWLAIAPG